MPDDDAGTCRELDDILPELAAGAAFGDVRANALAHAASCADCRRDLDQMATVFDELLLLAPEQEPPAGFDQRVLARLHSAAAPADRPDRRVVRNGLMLAAAFLLVAAAGVGAGWLPGTADRSLADEYRSALAVTGGTSLRAADIVGDGTTYGQVLVSDGEPAWLFLTMRAAGSGRYPVSIVTKDGQSHQIGTCTLRDGVGNWGGILDVPADSVTAVQLTRHGYPAMVAELS